MFLKKYYQSELNLSFRISEVLSKISNTKRFIIKILVKNRNSFTIVGRFIVLIKYHLQLEINLFMLI